jgi:hypothetical protein
VDRVQSSNTVTTALLGQIGDRWRYHLSGNDYRSNDDPNAHMADTIPAQIETLFTTCPSDV